MVLAPDHEDLAQSYHNLSVIYMCLLRMSDALPFCKKAVQILRKNHPQGHPNLEIAEENLPFIEKWWLSKNCNGWKKDNPAIFCTVGYPGIGPVGLFLNRVYL